MLVLLGPAVTAWRGLNPAVIPRARPAGNPVAGEWPRSRIGASARPTGRASRERVKRTARRSGRTPNLVTEPVTNRALWADSDGPAGTTRIPEPNSRSRRA